MSQNQTEGEWVTVPELAARLGQPERTVRRWVAEACTVHPEHIKTSRGILRRTSYRVNVEALWAELRPFAAN